MNRLILSSWGLEGMPRVGPVVATLNTEPRDRLVIAHSVGRCTVPGVAVRCKPRQSVRFKISCSIV